MARIPLTEGYDIDVCWSWEMPESLTGSTVVVSDVLAATSNIAFFLHSGAGSLTVADEQTVMEARNQASEPLIIGESRMLPEGFFRVSNRPSDIFRTNVTGRDIVYMSNNGTRVIAGALALGAERVMTVSLLNIHAVASWMRSHPTRRAVLVASGERTFRDKEAPEDRGCTDLLKKLLTGKTVGWKEELNSLKDRTARYYRNDPLGEEDLTIIFRLDGCPVVPGCGMTGNGTILVKHL
jgi:phosphosulfolactate phosphohydrolase-like enzyme